MVDDDVERMSLGEVRRRLDQLAEFRLAEWGPESEALWNRLAAREKHLIEEAAIGR